MIWGTKIAPFFLQGFTSTIVEAVKDKFPDVRLIVYMDDFVGVSNNKESAQKALNYLRETLTECGLKISEKKSSTQPHKHLAVLGYYLRENALYLDTTKN